MDLCWLLLQDNLQRVINYFKAENLMNHQFDESLTHKNDFVFCDLIRLYSLEDRESNARNGIIPLFGPFG